MTFWPRLSSVGNVNQNTGKHMNKPKYNKGDLVYCPNYERSFRILEVHPYPSPIRGTRYIYTIGTQMPEPMLTTIEEEFGDIDDE